MRTTISINEKILAHAKQKAADQRTTLGAVIEDALLKTFMANTKKSQPIRLLTVGGRGPKHGVDLNNSHSLLEIMEE